jgi:hypothetical protein
MGDRSWQFGCETEFCGVAVDARKPIGLRHIQPGMRTAVRVASATCAGKGHRAILTAGQDSPDVFVGVEWAYLSENGHDIAFVSRNPVEETLA